MTSPEKTYTPDQIHDYLAKNLLGWTYQDNNIQRTFKTGGWPYTLMAVNAIGYLCEAAWHHPELVVTWAQLIVKLDTHSAKGITDKDFELATKIENQIPWLPTDEQALTGFHKGFKKKWIR